MKFYRPSMFNKFFLCQRYLRKITVLEKELWESVTGHNTWRPFACGIHPNNLKPNSCWPSPHYANGTHIRYGYSQRWLTSLWFSKSTTSTCKQNSGRNGGLKNVFHSLLLETFSAHIQFTFRIVKEDIGAVGSLISHLYNSRCTY